MIFLVPRELPGFDRKSLLGIWVGLLAPACSRQQPCASAMRRFGGTVDLNASSLGGLDSSMLSMGGGCGEVNTTAHLEARKSLSSSQFGRGSFVKPSGAPPSTKKPAFPSGRPSMAHQLGDRCVQPPPGWARGQLFFYFLLCLLCLHPAPSLPLTLARTHHAHTVRAQAPECHAGSPNPGWRQRCGWRRCSACHDEAAC